MNYKLIGAPCGEHGPYKFYKAFWYKKNGLTNILALSEFFFVKLWPDSDLISIGELQLLWEDKNSEQTLASLRLYILPESTPDGRNNVHGEDEVLAISEKVVIRLEDLLTWIVTSSSWHWGVKAMWVGDTCDQPETPPEVKREPEEEEGEMKDNVSVSSDQPDVKPDPNNLEFGKLPAHPPANHPAMYPKSTALDMQDVLKEKSKLAKDHWEMTVGVIVLSYPSYCRYRGLLKRLEGVYNKWLRNALITALGGFTMPYKTTRVLFCKDTFDYPELEGHELLCNHLAPKLKGRPRRKRKKVNLSSEDSATESESSHSTSSSGTKPKVYAGSGVKPRLRCTLEVTPAPVTTISGITPLPGGAVVVKSSLASSSGSTIVSKDTAAVRVIPIQQKIPGGAMEEKRFLSNLHAFMRSRSTPIGRIPVVGFKEVNLFRLYKKVVELGGYETVTSGKLWKHVYENIGGDLTCTSAATLSRRHYEKLLLPYEKFLRSAQVTRPKGSTAQLVVSNSLLQSPQFSRLPGNCKVVGSNVNRSISALSAGTGRLGGTSVLGGGSIRSKEKENSAPSKLSTTTVSQPPSVTIIKKDGLKEEVIDFVSPELKAGGRRDALPVIKKQKLDMLKEGGLEVTPVGTPLPATQWEKMIPGVKSLTPTSTQQNTVVSSSPASNVSSAPPAGAHHIRNGSSHAPASSGANHQHNSKVNITVTPDMSHLMYPWGGNAMLPNINQSVSKSSKGAVIYRAGCALGLPVETVMGGGSNLGPTLDSLANNQLNSGALDLSTKPISIGSNLEISLVPATKKSSSNSIMHSGSAIPTGRSNNQHTSSLRYTTSPSISNQIYAAMKPGSHGAQYIPIAMDQSYLGNLVTQRMIRPGYIGSQPSSRQVPMTAPGPTYPVNFYKDLLRSQGIFNLLPDGSTSISLVGGATTTAKSTPTSK